MHFGRGNGPCDLHVSQTSYEPPWAVHGAVRGAAPSRRATRAPEYALARRCERVNTPSWGYKRVNSLSRRYTCERTHTSRRYLRACDLSVRDETFVSPIHAAVCDRADTARSPRKAWAHGEHARAPVVTQRG